MTAVRDDRQIAVVDTHVHVVSADTTTYPRHTRGDAAGQAGPKWYDTPLGIDGVLISMGKAGVRGCIIVQTEQLYEFDNSYVADCVATNSKTCRGVCIVDLRSSDAAKILGGWLVRPNMTGVRLFSMGSDRVSIDGTQARRVWEKAAESNVTVSLQIGAQDVGKLGPLLRDFGGTAVVLDHLAANAAPTLRISDLKDALALADFPNLCLKYTPVNLDAVERGGGRAEHFVENLVGTFGAHRVVWGSNYPATSGPAYKDLVAGGHASVSSLSDSDAQLVLGGNASRLWKLPLWDPREP
jgi:L-fuconolactonase